MQRLPKWETLNFGFGVPIFGLSGFGGPGPPNFGSPSVPPDFEAGLLITHSFLLIRNPFPSKTIVFFEFGRFYFRGRLQIRRHASKSGGGGRSGKVFVELKRARGPQPVDVGKEILLQLPHGPFDIWQA